MIAPGNLNLPPLLEPLEGKFTGTSRDGHCGYEVGLVQDSQSKEFTQSLPRFDILTLEHPDRPCVRSKPEEREFCFRARGV